MLAQILPLLREPWAMEQAAIERLVIAIADPGRSASAAARIESPAPSIAVSGRTAIVPVSGILIPSGAADLRAWGEDATGYNEIQAMLADANADPRVTDIQLMINSPGGAVSGCADCGAAIAASAKPVRATVQDLAASAAYWLGAQASGGIDAKPRSLVGSIGVYNVAADVSAMLAKFGISLHLISSGGIKGAGADGRVTDEMRAEMQKRVDAYASDFIDAVSSGRKMDRAAAASLATGHVWFAADAQAKGLIDTISGQAAATKSTPDTVATIPAAAHSPLTELANVDILDLIAAHSQHSAMIAASAKAGKTVDAIKAEIAAADHAAEIASAKAAAEKSAAELATEKARADKATADLAAEKARADKADADLSALKAMADGGKPGAKLKSDAPEPPPTKTADELALMTPSAKAAFFAAGGVLAK